MNWNTGKETKPLSVSTQRILASYGTETKLLQEWESSKVALEIAKERESNLRAAVFEINFPNPEEGTQRVELGNGYSLKAVVSYRYDLSNKDGKAEAALDRMAAISDEAAFIADRLIKWKPELSIKEYRPLTEPNASEDQKKLLALLQSILTITPGSPQVTLEPPKTAA